MSNFENCIQALRQYIAKLEAERSVLRVQNDNLQFRLHMASSTNPDSVLSKHNAMLMACDSRDEWAERANAWQKMHDIKAKRLEEATGLLDTASDAIDEACYSVWWERYRAFLSGAPAREEERKVDTAEVESLHRRIDALCGEKAAVEATLAAVRAGLDEARDHWAAETTERQRLEVTLHHVKCELARLTEMNSWDAGRVYCAQAVDDIAELCAPAPATGEEGT